MFINNIQPGQLIGSSFASAPPVASKKGEGTVAPDSAPPIALLSDAHAQHFMECPGLHVEAASRKEKTNRGDLTESLKQCGKERSEINPRSSAASKEMDTRQRSFIDMQQGGILDEMHLAQGQKLPCPIGIAKDIASLLKQVEKRFNTPVEIEFVGTESQVFIVQLRPSVDVFAY